MIDPEGPSTMVGDGHSERVPGGTAGKRQVEHHQDEGKCGEDGYQRNHASGQGAPDAPQGPVPTETGSCVEDGAGRRTQISVRDMHARQVP